MVEVIVAMTLLGIGIVSIGAGAAFASRVMRLADVEEGAARIATSVLDSLTFTAAWSAGSRDAGRLHAEWPAGRAGGDARIVVTVSGEPTQLFTYMTTVPPLLPDLPGVRAVVDSVP